MIIDLAFWKIDQCAGYFDRMKVRGWCHVPEKIITRAEIYYPSANLALGLASFGMPSPDVARCYGPAAECVRFEEWLAVPSELIGDPFSLRCTLDDGTIAIGRDALTNAATGDPYYQSWENFISSLSDYSSGAVLEIGSRARSAITRRHRIPSRLEYVGFDLLPGPNVDVIGDAHQLLRCFPRRQFAAIFSASVFEHLAMPWKVVIEINRVLAPGGIVYTSTHQTWPMHEEPWDFWRFSKHSWKCLFNPATGFEIIEAVMGEPATVHPCRTESVTRGMPSVPAYLGSACLARKVADTPLRWSVSVSEILDDMYPSGELATPPTGNSI